MIQNAFCEITISDESGHTRTYPAYTCGHCSNVVIMREDRTRPRKWCQRCAHWICEKTDLCATHCTPIHALANDLFHGSEQDTKYLPAIMAGATSIEEAQQKGLILTD